VPVPSPSDCGPRYVGTQATRDQAKAALTDAAARTYWPVLGANYLAWLIKYFGDVYFNGDYTLTTAGDCASNAAPCLINAVLAAYNYGFGRVDTAEGLVIPNPRYVENVRALMTECAV
jgi:hypothetical protein